MRTTYLLKIDADDLAAVERVLGIPTMAPHHLPWTVSVDSTQGFEGTSYVEHLLMMIDGKVSALAAVVDNVDHAISLWVLYEYDQQCNLEFSPKEMAMLSAHKVTLCISCWESVGAESGNA